jgi:hypothetical protein
MAAPLVAGLLGRERTSGGAGGLVQKLTSHARGIANHPNVPSGIAGALGSLGSQGRAEGPRRVEEPRRIEEPRRVEQMPHGAGHHGRRPWVGILAIGAVALGLWGIFGALRGHAPEHGPNDSR